MKNKKRILHSTSEQAVYKYCLERKEIGLELKKYNIFEKGAKQG
jgi:hypothetical protein